MNSEGFSSLGDHDRRLLLQEIDHAFLVHRMWVQRLQRAIRTQRNSLEVAEIGDAERCAIDGWLRSTSKAIRSNGLFAEVERAHRAFHSAAARTMELVSAGNFAAALAQLQPGGVTHATSGHLCDILERWRDVLR